MAGRRDRNRAAAAGSEVRETGTAQHVALLRRLANDGGGGRTYDAIIAECAVKAGATTLLTSNVRHFDPPPANLAIVAPA